MLLSSDYVPLNEKRKCHPGETAEVSDAARAAALARCFALSRLVGGLSARAYYLAATRDISRSRAIARRESPCLLQVQTSWQECSTNVFYSGVPGGLPLAPNQGRLGRSAE